MYDIETCLLSSPGAATVQLSCSLRYVQDVPHFIFRSEVPCKANVTTSLL